MRGLMVRWFFVLCFVGSHCLLAQPFFFRKDIRVENAWAVVTGDFNGDHRPDLAVEAGYGFVVLLNQGGGNFGPPIRTRLNTGSGPPFAVAGDFDGDGKDDLATADGLLLSRGDGTFLPPRQIGDLVPQGMPLAAGDFNRDGKLDLLLSYGWGVRLWLGHGDGTFQMGAGLVPWAATRMVVADFNRDGRSDVAVNAFPYILLFLGNGDGTFGPEIRMAIPTPLDANFRMRPTLPGDTFLLADFNGDGLPDIATASGTMLGRGDGTFQFVPYADHVGAKGKLPPAVAAADFTGDGRADLVLGNYESVVSIYPGKGDGTFLPALGQAVGWSAYRGGAAVDLDGDGRLDLVIANYYSNTVSLLMAEAQLAPVLWRAVSAASGTAIVAPQSLATLFAPAATTTANAVPLRNALGQPSWPTRLGGFSLEVRDSAGATRLAPLLFVSPTRIDFQVPAGTALGEATLAVVADGGSTQLGSMQVDVVAPGLFMTPSSRMPRIAGATAVRVEPDGTQTPIPLFNCSTSAGDMICEAAAIPLTAAVDRPIYLSFYGTGFGGATADSVACSIYGVPMPVVYAGPQGIPGVDQINIRLPPNLFDDYGLDAGIHWLTISLSIGGVASNTVSLDVE